MPGAAAAAQKTRARASPTTYPMAGSPGVKAHADADRRSPASPGGHRRAPGRCCAGPARPLRTLQGALKVLLPRCPVGPAFRRRRCSWSCANADWVRCRVEALARPLGRPTRPLPHARRPFVSWDCRCAAAPPKVRPSKTSRRRCQRKELHHERHPAALLQLHDVPRPRLRLRLPASLRAVPLRLRAAVPMRPAMPVRCTVPMRHRLHPVLTLFTPGATPAALTRRLPRRACPSILADTIEGTCP